jgi:hypothetical protein
MRACWYCEGDDGGGSHEGRVGSRSPEDALRAVATVGSLVAAAAGGGDSYGNGV